MKEIICEQCGKYESECKCDVCTCGHNIQEHEAVHDCKCYVEGCDCQGFEPRVASRRRNMYALGQEELLRRCAELNDYDLRGLFYMVFGGMTESDSWSTFYMVVNEFLKDVERKVVTNCEADCV